MATGCLQGVVSGYKGEAATGGVRARGCNHGASLNRTERHNPAEFSAEDRGSRQQQNVARLTGHSWVWLPLLEIAGHAVECLQFSRPQRPRLNNPGTCHFKRS
ncbi:UNVERIFIED_CONTAM: hypothetical protein FKN15_061699 [Acipenser sinensis]